VLGDTVNTAARLESSVAKPMMIVIGENTFQAAREHFEFRSLGRAALKGKEQEVDVHEVLAALRAHDGVAAREA
jgi:class 3 adenylate cyclase